MKPINVVVTCTKQKTVEADVSLQLRHIQGLTIPRRVAAWKKRADDWHGSTVTARRLYAGDHWSVAREIQSFRPGGHPINLWVISAGFGLLALDTPIPAYSATFSTRHPDTVVLPEAVTEGDEAAICKRQWWNALTSLEWSREKPISLTDLAAEFSDCPLLIAASRNYLHAIQDDLETVTKQLQSADLLALVSGGTDDLGQLTSNLVPCDARLQPLVGGILRSLNVRALRHYLQNFSGGKIGCRTMSTAFQAMLHQSPPRIRPQRLAVTDDELRQFVSTAIMTRTHVSQTRLLQELRASGRACEQTRFRTVFREVEAAHHE